MEELLRIMPTVRGPSAPPFETSDLPTSDAWQVDVVESSDMTYSMMVHKRVSQVTQMLNVRKQTWGYECRSGIAQYPVAHSGAIAPVATCAYRLKDVLCNITFYLDGTTLGMAVLRTATGDIIDVPGLVMNVPAGTNVAATQFQTFIVFTASGIGTWRISPGALDCRTWPTTLTTGQINPASGHFEELGKDVCPVPATMDSNGQYLVKWAETCRGDLLVYDGGNANPSNLNPDSLQDNLFHDPGQARPRTIALPISATYYRVHGAISVNGDSVSIADYTAANAPGRDGQYPNGYPDWEASDKNPFELNPPLPSRANGYRFVLVHKYTDILGQDFTWRSAPSTDWWIPSAYYAPAQFYPPFHDTTPKNPDDSLTDASIPFWMGIQPGDHNYLNPGVFNSFEDDVVTGNGFCRAIPGKAMLSGSAQVTDDMVEFFKLAALYRKQVNNEGYRPYNWASYYFGMRSGNNKDSSGPQDPDGRDMARGPAYGIQPYVPVLSAWEITRAPQTQFNWSDFGTLPADVVEIEIYRTAHACPSDKDNGTQSPLFQPQEFAYVGSVKPNQAFLDNVVDDALDFTNENVNRWNGYLAGEISGSVIRVHGDSFSTLILGDVTTAERLLGPVAEYSIRWPSSPLGAYSSSDFEQKAADGSPTIQFFLQYVDNKGNVSDAIPVSPGASFLIPTLCYFEIVPPRGYEPSITAINLIRSWYGFQQNATGGTVITGRDYQVVTTVDPSTTSAITSKATDYGAAPVSMTFTDSPTGVQTHSPGAITWSAPYDSMFWPTLNFEIHHQFAPVTGMSSVLGPLYVYTDQSVTKTDLAGRFELDSDKLGCVSRWALTKYEKVDLFLSKNGLCLSEGSSQRFVRGWVHTLIMNYLREEIPGHPSLANARRATIALMGRGRDEIWLRFPSSVDLGGSLPARTFIYREFEFTGLQQVYNYEFQVVPDSMGGDPQGIVLFAEHSDGRLFSSHGGTPLIIQDNDTDASDWQGMAALEIKCPMRELTVTKLLQSVWWWMSGKAGFQVLTGAPDAKGNFDNQFGSIAKTVRIFDVTILENGNDQGFKHTCSGPSVERRSRSPFVRFISKPDANGFHRWAMRAIRLTYALLGPNANQ